MIAKHITETILGRISDNEYVEDQALNTHIDSVEAMKAMLDDGFNRAIKRGNLEICLELKNRRSRLVSFAWICSKKNMLFSGKRFFEKFCKASLLEYSLCCARRGDINALTMLFLRHCDEILPHRLKVIDVIALDIDPSEYSYLLPVVPSDFFRSNCPKEFNQFYFSVQNGEIMTISETMQWFKDCLPDEIEEEKSIDSR